MNVIYHFSTQFLRPLIFQISILNHAIAFLSFRLQQDACKFSPLLLLPAHTSRFILSHSLYFSLSVCLSISLHLFRVFRHATLISISFPFCQIYPSKILYNSSLKLLAKHFFLDFLFASHNNRSSCSICKFLCQNYFILQKIFLLLFSLSSSYFSAPIAVFNAKLREFVWYLSCILSVIFLPLTSKMYIS